MQVEPCPTRNSDFFSAWNSASLTKTPQFIAAETSDVVIDTRGRSIMNQLRGILTPEGQINYSLLYPGAVKAWHRHQNQIDYWLCVSGHAKVGICHDDGRLWQIVIGESRPGILIIPPNLWHGMTAVGSQSCGMLYYVSRAYDPANPDEERRPPNSVSGFHWEIEHG